MEKLLPQNYAIYDTVYGSETPTEQYYTIKFDKIPSKFLDGGTFYDPMVVDEIKLDILHFTLFKITYNGRIWC